MSALTTIDAALAADVRGRVEAVRSRIEAAAQRAGRDPAEVTLVGVSKRQPPERVAAAVEAGVSEIGENYVQEAIAKIPQVHALIRREPPRWRMIGGLQRNKARAAVEWFSLVETVDRESLARALDQRVRDTDRSEPLPIFLQVNLSREPQKSGAAPDAVGPLLAACGALTHVRVEGLMSVPAASPDPEQSRPAFAALRALRDALRERSGGEHLRELSMGMSADFEIAIEEGATCVRVGTAIFGPRPEPGAPQ